MRCIGSAATAGTIVLGCSTTVVHAPTPVGPTDLVVASEHVTIDCVGADDTLACSVRATATVSNPKSSVRSTLMEVKSSNAREVRVSIDHEVVASRLAGGDARFPLAVAPYHRRAVSMTADTTLTAVRPLWSAPALVARHPWLGEESGTRRASVRYCPSARGDWAEQAEPTVAVVGPARWTFEDAGWKRKTDGEYTRSIGRRCEDLRWQAPSRGIPLYHGGPIVGAGATFGEGARLRLGYEGGISSWLVGSLYGETNGDDEVVVVPVVEAATEAFFIVPSFGAGIGVPVRFAPQASAGVRGQVTIMWAAGASFALDYYPTDGVLQASLLGQVGF